MITKHSLMYAYYQVEVPKPKNTFGILVCKANNLVQNVTLYRKHHTPGAIGKVFTDFDEAQMHYSTPEIKNALLLIETNCAHHLLIRFTNADGQWVDAEKPDTENLQNADTEAEAKTAPEPQSKSKFKVTPRVMDEYQPGAILEDTWGYEQTNVDFYVIVDRKPGSRFVTILPMLKNVCHGNGMVSQATPGEVCYNAAPIRKAIKTYGNLETGFSLRPYTGGGWCRLWDGKTATETHYG